MWGGLMCRIVVIGVLCMLLFSSCGKPDIKPNIIMQEVLVEYDADNIGAFAAAEDGTVYIVGSQGGASDKSSGLSLRRYDCQGELTGEYPLDDYFFIRAAAAGADGSVYFTAQGSGPDLCLYRFYPDTGQIDPLCSFSYFVNIKQLVCMGERVYVLGQQRWKKLYAAGADYDFSAEERLVYYNEDDGEVYDLGLEFPVNIARGIENKLAVLGYLPAAGYCLMEYDPKSDSMEVKREFDEFLFDNFAVSGEGELIYSYMSNPFGLLLTDGSGERPESELFREAMPEGLVGYAGGMVFCQRNDSKHLVSFPLEKVRRNNRTVRLITAQGSDAPYGCGYVLDRIDMDWDKLVLKALAQDKDYDLCIASTADSGTGKMRDSASFYPLNGIPGVEEYLERCFPYVREAAVKEDGTIWMLPYRIWIRGFLVQEEKLEQAEIPLQPGITCAGLAELVCGLDAEQRKLFNFSPYYLAQCFIDQYLWKYSPSGDGLFLTCMENWKQLYRDIPEIPAAPVEDILYRQTLLGWGDWSEQLELERYEEERYSFYSFPKAEEGSGNCMVCCFLAVNPNSERLEEALSYIADLAAFLTAQDGVWYFTDLETEPGSFAEQVHNVCRDGELPFATDADVYRKGLEKALSGELGLEEYVEEVIQKYRMYLEE